MFNADKNLMEKWQPVMEAAEAPAIKDAHKRAVTAVMLENTEKALAEERGHQNFLTEQKLHLLTQLVLESTTGIQS